jgi:uncharacterized glyoxalase superfamily protein PhnB
MSDRSASQPGGTPFEGCTPILRVRSLTASVEYYVKVLGFKVDWHQFGVMASVSRDGCAIMLCEGDQGNPGTWIWIGIGDVDILFQEYTAAGAEIRLAPTNYSWAYEMQVEDPDGHVLRFGSDPKTDRVFSTWVVVARDREPHRF